MAAGERLENNLGVKEKTIKRACHIALNAHTKPEKPFVIRRSCRSSKVIFAFPGTWTSGDWLPPETSNRHFGETKLNPEVFPSLRSVGNAEIASVNDAFLRRFLSILEKPMLLHEVEKFLKKSKRIIFTGHSGGGPIAIFATVWLFEYLRSTKKLGANSPPLCLTFGSPLVGDHIFHHALRRENWSEHFVHFVSRYDIIPRIMLTPPRTLPDILSFFSKVHTENSIQATTENDGFVKSAFENVIRNASSVASRAACILIGSTNHLVDTISSFIEISPYRPSGTYVFCYGKGKSLVVKNSDAVLQLLVYCSQLSNPRDALEIARASFTEHLAYKIKLEEIARSNRDLYYLEKFRELPLNSEECEGSEARAIDAALNDLSLGTRASLCLRVAREAENQKISNREKIAAKKEDMEKAMTGLEEYRTSCETRGVGYYDSFKQQKYQEDFATNVKRLELAGMWDEIIEMLKRYELPDGFEGDRAWVELGTRFRRLVEPLDIANYYRNALYSESEKYMKPGSRPKRYWYTQRWWEHYEQMPEGSSWESTFWAEVEQLRIAMAAGEAEFGIVKERVLELEKKLKEWYDKNLIRKEVFLPESTLVKWWKTLPEQHRTESCIKELAANPQ